MMPFNIFSLCIALLSVFDLAAASFVQTGSLRVNKDVRVVGLTFESGKMFDERRSVLGKHVAMHTHSSYSFIRPHVVM